MTGIVSLFAARMLVPTTRPFGVGVSDGFTDGLIVVIGAGVPDGRATGVTVSALDQIQPTLSPVAASAATTRTSAPIIRAFVPVSALGRPTIPYGGSPTGPPGPPGPPGLA